MIVQRRRRRWLLTLWLVSSAAVTPVVASEDPEGDPALFGDGFESGNTLGWDQRVPPEIAPDAFRFTDLDLRDPHVFVDLPGFGCVDFTDEPLPGGFAPSFNEQLAAAIEEDGDRDGLLDLSVVYGFRPFEPLATALPVDHGVGACLPPADATICDWDIPPVPPRTTYDGLDVGLCLTPHPGTTSGYEPPPAMPMGPCVVTQPRVIPFEIFEHVAPFFASQAAATLVGSPVALEGGLFLGFLTEADANAILLPEEIPVVGGQPFSVLLPGGEGNCARGDDRDIHDLESGWWFYFDFTGAQVPFIGD